MVTETLKGEKNVLQENFFIKALKKCILALRFSKAVLSAFSFSSHLAILLKKLFQTGFFPSLEIKGPNKFFSLD